MKKTTFNPMAILFALCAIIYSEKSTAQTYQWAKSASSQGYDYGNGIITDDSGNVYIAGQIEYSCDFGNGVVLNTAGKHDIFLAKYNSAGTLKWAKRAGGPGGDVGWGIGLDASRNIYLTGEVENGAGFAPGDTIYVNGGPNNAFLAKYNNDGAFLWVERAGGNADAKGRPLVVDPAGYIYSSGYFTGAANFGTQNITATAGNDMFLAKWDTAGNCIWVKKGGGNSEDRGRGLALDASGNVFVTGTFTSSANFSGTNITGTGWNDTYTAKYNSSGTLQWVRTGSGTDTTRAMAAACDNNGNVYITGYFINSTTFGSTTLTSLGSYEFFMAKYDASGNLIWAKRGGGPNEDFGQGISFDKKSNLLYVTGQFDSQATFDGLSVTSAGNRDVFISAWDTSGSIQWIKTGGGSQRDAGFAVANDTLGNIFGTGFFDFPSASFGTNTVSGDSLANIFVTKISPAFASEPTTASTNISSTIINCNDVNLTWTSGNGSSRMVIAKAGSAVSIFPVDGNYYTANSTFGNGSYLGSGNYVVYSGSGNSCTVTGLTVGTHYYFAVVEFNGSGVTSNYNTSSYLTANAIANSFNVTASSFPTSFCPGGTAALTASGGLTYTWSPATGLDATTGSTVNATLNSSVTYTVNATDINGCHAATTVSVTVNPLPTVTLNNLTDACITSTSVALTGGSPAGGTYSGSFVTAGTFDASSAGLGSHDIFYSYTDGNGCSNADTASINVRALPTVDVSTQNSVCINASPVALTNGTPAGGTYSGTGVSSGNFDPSVTGTGVQIITYSYVDTFGCANSDTATIMVNALPTVTLGTFNSVCVNGSAVVLSGGSPAGGTYNGTSVVSGNFYPNIAGVGQFTITYAYSDANGCMNNASNTITVNALPTVTLGSFNAVCQNSGGVTLTGGLPAGGLYSGSNVGGGVFTPTVVGSNTIIYNYTDGNGCSNFATSTIMVNVLPTVTVSPFNPVCQNTPAFALTGGSPAGGIWTGSGVAAGNFYSTTLGNNTVIYNYTDGNGCTNHANTTIVVNANPVVALGVDTTVCANSNILIDAGAGYTSYLWSTGATTQSILVDTVGIGIGTTIVTVTVSNAANCTANDNIHIMFDICAGINPITQQPPLAIVYPNPFSDELTIYSDANEKNITITFCDVLGNIILKKTISKSTETINPDVPAGIYFLRVEKGKTVSTIKVVKTK